MVITHTSKNAVSSPQFGGEGYAQNALHVKIQKARYRNCEMKHGEERKKRGWTRKQRRSRVTASVVVSPLNEEGSNMVWRPVSAGTHSECPSVQLRNQLSDEYTMIKMLPIRKLRV